MLKLACTKLERLTEVKYCDVLIKFGLLVVLGVLRLTTDRVALLPVYLGVVVVPGPHCYTLHIVIFSAVSGSEDLVSGEDGASTASLATARYGQSDLPRIFISLNIHSANNLGSLVGSSTLALVLSSHQTDGQSVPGGGV